MGQSAAASSATFFQPPAGEYPTKPAARQAIQKVNYSHDAMIDLIIQWPGISQNDIALHFGYTPGWVSQVFSSDAFQSRLADRKNELVDPAIKATVEERFKALVLQSYEILKRKLESPAVEGELALNTLKAASQALGYGARQQTASVNAQLSAVVQLPPKAVSSEAWERAHSRSDLGGERELIAASPPLVIEGESSRSDSGPMSDGPLEHEGDRLLDELEKS